MKINHGLDAVRAHLAPLYCRYSREPSPQPAYLWIDLEKETVEADYDGAIGQGGTPLRVYHGFVRRVGITPYIKGDALAELLESKELSTYVQRMIDGFESVWDGNNHVAKLTPDAEEAERELELHLRVMIDPAEQVTVYTPDEWIESSLSVDEGAATIAIESVGTITADSTDPELEAMVVVIDKQAKDEGAYLEPRVIDALEDLRTRCAQMRNEQHAND